MNELDPDHVAVMAAQVHAVFCVPGTGPKARWTLRHSDKRPAERLLDGLRNAGYTLTPISKENS